MSSKQSRRDPPYIFTYSSFRMMFLAFPMWRGPDGKGASLMITFPFSAFSNSRRPSLVSRFEVLESEESNSFCCCSGDIEFTFFRTSWIFGMMFFISDFSRPSANRPARTAPWFALPLCLIAFSRV